MKTKLEQACEAVQGLWSLNYDGFLDGLRRVLKPFITEPDTEAIEKCAITLDKASCKALRADPPYVLGEIDFRSILTSHFPCKPKLDRRDLAIEVVNVLYADNEPVGYTRPEAIDLAEDALSECEVSEYAEQEVGDSEGDWFCVKCQSYLCNELVSNAETHDSEDCNGQVVFHSVEDRNVFEKQKSKIAELEKANKHLYSSNLSPDGAAKDKRIKELEGALEAVGDKLAQALPGQALAILNATLAQPDTLKKGGNDE